MNVQNAPRIAHSACPHDCPSTCALDVEIVAPNRIGRIRGAEDNSYTDGVICAKVARYAERVHNQDRLLHPLRRVGAKGSAEFKQVSWEEALDVTAEAMLAAEARHGPEAVWPHYYAGTMGLLQRDGIHRLRHEKKYSRQYDTICSMVAMSGFYAGTGKMAGPDPREMAKSDFVVIWGTNPVATQVNVMTHAVKARKTRGAKIAVVDVYETPSVKQADLAIILKPGTDAALACAVMHVLFRDGYADWDYLERYSDHPKEFAEHLSDKTPEWASAITGMSVDEIENFATMFGANKRTFIRAGYGFTRGRNGIVSMHAVTSIPTVTGAWRYEGGGAFMTNAGIYEIDNSVVVGRDMFDPSVRTLDQSQIGRVLTGDSEALKDGPPVDALFIQNTNPVCVSPEQTKVREGFAREDLFVCVHEQFMTETAKAADIVLPATMFLEHDDLYRGGGHQYILFGGKLIDPPGECRSNHAVLRGLAERLGLTLPGFFMSERECIDTMLTSSGRGSLQDLEANRWIDCQPDFATSHYLDGFCHPDGKFHFKPDWPRVVPPMAEGLHGAWDDMPEWPDYWTSIEEADAEHPFRLATSPARSFLNTTFTETDTSRNREGRPEVLIHPDDAAVLRIADDDLLRMGNERGSVLVHARLFDNIRKGVLVSEGIWPNDAFLDGIGINTLVGADPIAPFGGAAFHDIKVWLRKDGSAAGRE